MKIFTASQIRAADAYTIKHEPIPSIDLMERAARKVAEWFNESFDKDVHIKIFVGPGNNGGDGWALARMLFLDGYKNLTVYLLKISDRLSPDSEINRVRLREQAPVKITELKSGHDFPEISPGEIIVDALFGSGLSRPLDGLARELVEHINKAHNCDVVAIDIPSGQFAEENPDAKNTTLKASITLSFQFPKLSFFFSENEEYVGNWQILPIGLHESFIAREETPYNFCTQAEVAELVKSRKKFSHKGTYGHTLLIAGTYGMMGAAVLAAKAALHAGSGLVSCHVPRMAVDIMQISVPEALLSIDESDILFSEHPPLEKYSAIAVGPGLNQKSNTRKALIELLKNVKVPVVLDADALNILSQTENWQDIIPSNAILTPHPREFERLFGNFPDSFSRLEAQREFSGKSGTVVILKQAHTCISLPDGSVWFNTTGNPGMATGGSGDVLTGILAGLLAQGYSLPDASKLGVYLHGMAGDLALQGSSMQALIASDILNNIGVAFNVLDQRHTKL